MDKSEAQIALKEHLISLDKIQSKITPLQNKIALIEQAEEKVAQAKASIWLLLNWS